MDTTDFVCLNPSCSDYLLGGRKNIILASVIKTKRKEHSKRWRCKTCGRYYSENRYNFRYRLRADKDELTMLVDYYLHEYTIASIAMKLGRDTRTISNWLKLLTENKSQVIDFLEKECQLSSDQIKQLREKYFNRGNFRPRK